MNAALARLMAWYQGLEAREQRMVAIGSVALGLIVLVGAVLLPVQSATSAAKERVAMRREDLEWMQKNAPLIEAAGVPPGDDHDPPVVIVDRVARQDGLGDALRGTQPSPNGVRVQLEAAPFDTLITWVATLDSRYGLALDSITVDRGARPGLVNANVTFSTPKR
jgi:general secretion pathway protein M